MTRLPPTYVAATWRNVTPVDAEAEVIGLGLNLPSGEVLRVALAVDGARQMAEALTRYLGNYRRASGAPIHWKARGVPAETGREA